MRDALGISTVRRRPTRPAAPDGLTRKARKERTACRGSWRHPGQTAHSWGTLPYLTPAGYPLRAVSHKTAAGGRASRSRIAHARA